MPKHQTTPRGQRRKFPGTQILALDDRHNKIILLTTVPHFVLFLLAIILTSKTSGYTFDILTLFLRRAK
jgi:hypothetical protein